MPSKKALVFVLVCWLGGLCSFSLRAYPQTAEDVVRVSVTARQVQLKEGQPAGLHWVLDALPQLADVTITNPKVKKRFIQAIQGFRANSQSEKCLAMVVEGGVCSFTGFITVKMASDNLNFIGPAGVVKKAPNAEKASSVQVLRAKYSVVDQTVGTFCIVASTQTSPPAPCSQPDPLARDARLGDLAAQYGLGPLSDSEAEIKVRTHFSDSDRVNGKGGLWPEDQMADELRRTAVTAFEVAQLLQLIPGAKDPAARQTEAENRLLAIYTIQHSTWPKVFATYGPEAPNGSQYQFTIRNLHFIKSTDVILTRGNELGAQEAKTESQLQAKLRQASQRVAQRYQAELHSLAGTIPTNESVWKVARQIADAPEITGGVEPTDSEGKMIFTADHRWMLGSIDAKSGLEFSLNPHEIVSGEAQVNEVDLGFRHTAGLTVRGGPELQKTDFDFDLTRTRGKGEAWKYGFHLNTEYLRDQNQRFGLLTGPKFLDQEYGPTPKAFLEFTPALSGKRASVSTAVDLGVRFRHYGIQMPSGVPPFQNRGWANAFAPEVRQLLGYDFSRRDANRTAKAGLGQFKVSLDWSAELARPNIGSDFDFDRHSASARAEMFWGITGPEDFFLRYRRGVGASSATTPLFALFRLGGPANVRGIEEGESVGRGLGYDQSTVGVNARSIWHWIRRMAATAPQGPASLSALGIGSIFLDVFYDRGKLSSSSSLGDLLDLAHGVHGLGVAGELRGLRVANKRTNLGLGYARSPASVFHSNGIFVTELSTDF